MVLLIVPKALALIVLFTRVKGCLASEMLGIRDARHRRGYASLRILWWARLLKVICV